MAGDGFLATDEALIIHIEQYSGNLQQGITFRVKAAGFDINHDRKEAAKTSGNRRLFISV